MDKLVERIAQINNFTFYLGNEQIHKLRRQDIIKQVIDIITLHDKTLRVKNIDKRTRQLNAFRNYGISSDYTFFFIFPLTNDIFKSSSKELDKFKKVKVNNIITYILLFMILELNDSQVIMFDYNKVCNYILFDRFKKVLFDKLMLKTDSSKNLIPVIKLDTLCYILYYCSCMLSKFNLWYIENTDNLNSLTFKQKSIIHTFLDLVNSILESFSNNNNFIYEMLGKKITGKINTLFKKSDILEIIKKKEEKKITINNNKILITKSKIDSIILKKKMTSYKSNIKDISQKGIYYYSKLKMPPRDMNEIIGKELNTLYKNYELKNKIKLAQIYDKNGLFRRFKLSFEDASKLNIKLLDEIMANVAKKKKTIYSKKQKKDEKILAKQKDRLLSIKFESSLDDLLKEILKIDNKTIKINEVDYNIYEPILNLNSDYLGNPVDKNFNIEIKNNKITVKFDKELNIDVYEIYDASNDIKLIFNKYSLHYLGYKIKSNKFTNLKNLNIYAKYIPSLKEIFETIGFKKNYFNFENKNELENELRNSISNLKEYIRKYNLNLNQLKNKSINDSNKIIKFYINKIDNLKLVSNNLLVFDDIDIILKHQNTTIDKIDKLNNISKEELLKLTETYSNLSNYLINELVKLLKINDNKFIRNNLTYFLISLTVMFYYENFNQYEEFDLIRFSQIMKLDIDLIEEIKDEKMIYKEDEYVNENTDEQKEEVIEATIDYDEMNDALDIHDDDYDPEDGDEEVMFHDEDN